MRTSQTAQLAAAHRAYSWRKAHTHEKPPNTGLYQPGIPLRFIFKYASIQR